MSHHGAQPAVGFDLLRLCNFPHISCLLRAAWVEVSLPRIVSEQLGFIWTRQFSLSQNILFEA